MGDLQVFLNPCDQMVLEHAFDNLMEEVWGEYLMDISSREGGGEWLVQKITYKRTVVVLHVSDVWVNLQQSQSHTHPKVS